MALHFSRKLVVPLDPSSKARSFALTKQSEAKCEVVVSYHGNMLTKYSILEKKKKK